MAETRHQAASAVWGSASSGGQYPDTRCRVQRKEADMSTPQKIVSPGELFALYGGQASAADELSLRRAIPVAPISEGDLLELATRARWPKHTLIARALAKAINERLNTSSRPTHRDIPDKGDPDIGWNFVLQRGITGRVGGFELLIGTRRFVENAGIVIAEPVARMLDGYNNQGWASALVAARRQGSNPDEQHQSLIGILAFGSKTTSTPMGQRKSTTMVRPMRLERARILTNYVTILWHHLSMFLTRARIRRWQWLALFVCVSSLAGTLLSLVAVAPDEAAIVQRFGRAVACCGPGLHLRPLWAVETIILIHPHRLRTVQIGSPLGPTSLPGQGADPPISELVMTGDVYAITGSSSQPTSNHSQLNMAKSASQLLRIDARVQYVISDIHAFVFGTRDPDELVAASAESVLRELIGSQSMMASLGPQRGTLTIHGKKLLQDRLDVLGCGILIHAIILDDLQPALGTASLNVTEAFNQVTQANADRADAIAQAQAEYEHLVDKAKAQAEKIHAKAQAEQIRDIAIARRQVEWVQIHHAAFRKAPELLRRKMLIDLIAETESRWRTIILDPTLNDAVRLMLEVGEPARSLDLETIENHGISDPTAPKGGGP